MLKRVVGAIDQIAVQNIKQNETLMLIVGSLATIGQVTKIGSKSKITFDLRKPVAIIPGQRVAISRQIEMRWRLIGWGTVFDK